MKEHDYVFSRIKEYFLSLGYNETMFDREISLNNPLSGVSKADFVVKQNNKPYIIVEAKLGKAFVNLTNDELRYDPSVRQVQTYATYSGAEFYVITNGNEFLWFKTGSDGRPERKDPVFFHSNNMDNILGVTIGEALNLCAEMLKADAMSSDYLHELILILLARFAVKKRGDPPITSDRINEILKTHYHFNMNLVSRVSPEALKHCWFILSECKPEKADQCQLINSLKLLSQKAKSDHSFRLNTKIPEFLTKLADIRMGQVVLDPSANWGEIASAVARQNGQKVVYSYCQSEEQYAFLALLNKIMYNEIRNIRVISIRDYVLESMNRTEYLKPDVIISAFPFGNRNTNLAELRYIMPIELSNIEDYMLGASLEMLKAGGRLVAIIPESMLFAGGKRRILRQYIIEQYCLKSVISLPVGAVSRSNVKTSIIIIDKAKRNNDGVFFGSVNNADLNEYNLFTDSNHRSIGLLRAYETFLSHGFVQQRSERWNVLPISSDIENLRTDALLSIDEPIVESQYPLCAIRDICEFIKRGSAIKIDENGTIPFLGPAAIRPNKIDESKYSYTSENHIKKSQLLVEKGMVLVNNISSNLGAAAVVESDNVLPINQHIIALTPMKHKVLAQYLAIALNSKDVNNSILRASTGVTIPSITLERLKEIRIPVPTLVIQQQIIDSVNRVQDELVELEKQKAILEKKLTSVINSLEPEGV